MLYIYIVFVYLLADISSGTEREEIILSGDYSLEMWILVPSTVSNRETIAEKEGQFEVSVTVSAATKCKFSYWGCKNTENKNGNIFEEIENVDTDVWNHLTIGNSATYQKAILMTETQGGEIGGWLFGESPLKSLLAIGGSVAHESIFSGRLLEVRLWTAYRGRGNIYRDRHQKLLKHSFQLAQIWKPLESTSTRILATSQYSTITQGTYIHIYIYIYSYLN